jgi:hypothetical protein
LDKITLVQQAKSGKNKLLKIWTDGNTLYREWGLEGCKMQVSSAVCTPKNLGKTNELTAEAQAELEAEAIIKRKIHEGYRYEGTIAPEETLDFSDLQSSFAPSKPISDPPRNFESNMGLYCAERKNNGACLIHVVTPTGTRRTFTRGMRDITEITSGVTPIDFISKIPLPQSTIILYEFIHYDVTGKEVPKELRGIINERTTNDKSIARYKALKEKGGTFSCKIFDVLVLNGTNVSMQDYAIRRSFLDALIWCNEKFIDTKSTFFEKVTSDVITKAEQSKWEGLILRKMTGPESSVEYTLNGKPSHKGAWKYVFEKTSDFVVIEFQKGSSGRLLGLPARFKLAQYNEEGILIDCGWAGPGRVPTEDLITFEDDFGTALTSKELVAEITYRKRSDKTNALEFPVIQRFRTDKPAKECILDDSI